VTKGPSLVIVPGDPATDVDTGVGPLRLVDVVAELHRIADMATAGSVQGPEVAAACRRAESLLARLRNQFLDEVVLEDAWGGVSTA
jgi:hypothetical protein